MRSVQGGPKNKDMIYLLTALFPFVCARAALIRDKVNQPTAYSPVPVPKVIMRSNLLHFLQRSPIYDPTNSTKLQL